MERMSEVNIGNSRQQVAAELKRVREAARLSQEQMATRLGMAYAPGGRRVSTGRAAVSAWESGKRTPSPQYLEAYVRLGGDPQILTPRADPPPRQPPDAAPQAAESEVELILADAGERGGTAGPHPRHGQRWLGVALAAVVVVVAATLYATTRSSPSVPAASGPASTWTETTGTPAHTWADATQLTGAGTPLGPRQSVQVSCRVRGYVVEDGDPWWYRLASAPWNGRYYATSDAFYNNGATSGSVDTGVVVDEQVPVCSSTP